jgi:deoxyribonuclease-4
MLLLGAHLSIAGGVSQAFARAEELGCTAMQIFTKNASQWRSKPLPIKEIEAFANAWEKSPVASVTAHDSYLINLAAADGDKRSRSLAAFLDEMERCAALGIPGLVMHPGAHLGAGEEVGLQRIAEALRSIFAETSDQVTVLLENTAGQGSYLGHRFEHLAEIMERVPAGRIGVCFDTCHALAAGYDLTSADGYQTTMAEFDRLIGTRHIAAFHLNDSLKERGSRVDRHAHIGQGAVALETFAALMTDERFTEIPKLLETAPGENNCHHIASLALLRQMAEKAA